MTRTREAPTKIIEALEYRFDLSWETTRKQCQVRIPDGEEGMMECGRFTKGYPAWHTEGRTKKQIIGCFEHRAKPKVVDWRKL